MSIKHERPGLPGYRVHLDQDKELTACFASVLDLCCPDVLPLFSFERPAGVETG
jgi:hypothetical protein